MSPNFEIRSESAQEFQGAPKHICQVISFTKTVLQLFEETLEDQFKFLPSSKAANEYKN